MSGVLPAGLFLLIVAAVVAHLLLPLPPIVRALLYVPALVTAIRVSPAVTTLTGLVSVLLFGAVLLSEGQSVEGWWSELLLVIGVGGLAVSLARDRERDVLLAQDTVERLRGERVAGDALAQQVRSEADEARRRLAFLAETSRAFAEASVEREATNRVLCHVCQSLAMALSDGCAICQRSDDGQWLNLVARAHRDPAAFAIVSELAARRWRSDHGIVGQVIATGQPYLVNETSSVELQLTDPQGSQDILGCLSISAVLVVPLRVRGQTIGTIGVWREHAGHPFTIGDQMFLQDIADRIAVALDNTRLYYEAQEAIRIRDEVLSLASHDLKNPLTFIKGLAQALQRRPEQAMVGRSDQIMTGLARIDASVTKMTALIDELLDVAHVQMGQPLQLNRHPTDLVSMALQVAAENQQATERHEIRVDATVPDLVGVWDALRLERVLNNLISNAIKFSPDGGEITVRLGRDDLAPASAVVTIADQGLGIPVDDVPHIFRQFHRAGNVLGLIAGSGLGLACAYQIVEQHGGAIAVKTAEGEGTTFTVRLPFERGQTVPRQPTVPLG